MPDTPVWNTNIRILESVGVDPANTLYAASKSALDSYLLSKTKFTGDEYSFIRPDKQSKNGYNNGCVHVALPYDATTLCDYVAFQETDVSDRWMYGRVTNREYVNVNSTRLYFSLDYWLTYYDLLKPGIGGCVIKRTHVKQSDDWQDGGIWPSMRYLEPEPYTPTPIKREYTNADNDLSAVNAWLKPNVVMVMATSKEDGEYDPYSTGYIVGEPTVTYAFVANSIEVARTYLGRYFEGEATENVISASIVPTVIFSTTGNTESVSKDFRFTFPARSGETLKRTDGLVVQNAKCLLYPACYLTVECYGNTIDLSPEDYMQEDGICTGTVYIGGQTQPKAAMFFNRRNDDALTGGHLCTPNYPSLLTLSSGWAAYNAQNKISSIISIVGGVAEAGAGIGTIVGSSGALAGQGISMITGGVMQAANTAGEWLDAKNLPNKSKGSQDNDSDLAYVTDKFRYNVVLNAPTNEEFTRFDNYLTRYGYTQKTYKVPDLCVRRYFTYVACESVEIAAPVPSEGIDQVRQMLLNGVTFWNCAQGDIGEVHVENPDA